MIKRIIRSIDRLVVHKSHWQHIPNSSQDLFYVVPCRYKGKTLTLIDGTVIKKGDLVAELHVDNTKMVFLDGQLKSIYRVLTRELHTLASAIEYDDNYKQITAFFGQTVLYPILRKKGFTIRSIDNKLMRLAMGLGESLLRLAYATGGRKLRFYEPKICWISSSQIINLYKASGNE